MPLITIEKYYQILNISENLPSISLIIPFVQTMKNKSELHTQLTEATDKLEVELLEKYPEEIAAPVIKKLRRLIEDTYQMDKKSIAIFVSPLTESIFYFTPTGSTKDDPDAVIDFRGY